MLGKTIIDHCSQCDCGEKRLIVNKTHYLCQQKNQERLLKKKNPRQKTLKIKKLSNSTKQRIKNEKYTKIIREIADERGMVCQGCGTTERLSFSHLIPRSRRPDLITNKKNIHIHCMDGDGVVGCHTKAEAGRYDELLDGELIKQSIKELDAEYYRIKVLKNEIRTS